MRRVLLTRWERVFYAWCGPFLLAAWLLVLFYSLAFAQQGAPPPPPSELDMCRQQLAGTHDTADSRERKAALAMAELNAAAEARAATLIEWLKAAQSGAKP